MASVGTILWRVTVLQWFVSYPLANIWRVLCSTKVGCVSRDGVSLLETRHLGRRSLGPPVAASCPVIQLLLARVQAVLAAFFPVCSFERTMWVGPVQERFMNALGYRRRIEPPDRDIHI